MDQLRAIARRIMSERNLLPDFSPRALADSSRDLDQLSAAESLPGGASMERGFSDFARAEAA